MNFFGHAVVASWRSSSPPYLLGAMVPDFATMLGTRVPTSTHPDVTEGIRFHHLTDEVFHGAPTFRELSAAARSRLRDLGVPRPAALAVGHIGVEILLDGALADGITVGRYLTALAAAQDPDVRDSLSWPGEERAMGFVSLIDALASRGASRRDPELSAWRIVRALSPRPRLRLDERGEDQVRLWALEAEAGIHAAAPRLLGELAAGLASGGVRIP